MRIQLESSQNFQPNEIVTRSLKQTSYSISILEQQAKSEEYSCISSLSHFLNSILNFLKKLFCCDYTVKSESEINQEKFFQSAISECEEDILHWIEEAEKQSKNIHFYFKSKSFSMNYFLKYSPNSTEKQQQKSQIIQSFESLKEATENKDFDVHFFLIEDGLEPGKIDYEKHCINVYVDGEVYLISPPHREDNLSPEAFQTKINSHYKNVTFQL